MGAGPPLAAQDLTIISTRSIGHQTPRRPRKTLCIGPREYWRLSLGAATITQGGGLAFIDVSMGSGVGLVSRRLYLTGAPIHHVMSF
jgi:hypothetical protein